MKKLSKILVAGLLACSSLAFATEFVLMGPKAGLPEQAAHAIMKQHGGKNIEKLSGMNVYRMEAPKGTSANLAKSKFVKFAEVDQLVAPDYIANDTYFNNAWHLHKMNVPAAWDITEGSGIIVAVADSGVITTHLDLAGQVLPGFNTVDNTTNSNGDLNSHGTMVAGTVAALTNNARGVSSMMGKAKILPIRITNTVEGNAYFSDMAEAVTYAANNGARVVNVSYGGGGNSSTIQSAANYMVSKGGVVVWSAGNDNIDPGYYDNPNIILVSATGSNDLRTSWSSFGAYVDVAAPGSGIYTTNNAGGYSTVNGTSFSSPIVAATVAGMLSVNPNLVMSQVDRILKETAVDLGTVGEDIYYGAGRVDTLAAIQAAMVEPTIDSINPIATITSPTAGATLRDTVVVSVNATDNTGVTKVELRLTNTLIATETSAPYDFALDTLAYPNGSYTLSATAYDAAGNTNVSTVSVFIANNDFFPPVITINSPTDGGRVSGKKPIKVTSSAVDESGGVVTQKLYINNSLVATVQGTTLSYNWNIGKLPLGQHVLRIEASDVSGNVSTKSITVTKI